MRSITKQLDMSPGAISPVVHVSQYDSDFSIVFNLYCTDGSFTIESGTTAEIRGTKKSGTGYSATATVNISAKTVTVAGHKQMTAVAGDNIYEITLYKGSKELNSINFVLAVERAAMDQDTVVDETTIREFGELETYIEGVKADTAASASAAQASQTAAAASASASAQSAIEAAQSAQSVDAERLNRIAFGSYVVEGSTGAIAHFEDGADNIPMKDVLVHIEPVQAGSGDPSPDNVRAITGWTAASVTRRGKNLMGKPTWTTSTQDGVTATLLEDGRVSVTGTGTNTEFAIIVYNSVDLPAGTYIFNGQNNADVNKKLTLQAYNITDDTQIVNRDTATDYTFTLDKPSRVTIRIGLRVGVSVTDAIMSPMIRHVSSADPTYEPYASQTRSITFPTSAGTIYGGTLDVTKGELVVDRVCQQITTAEIKSTGVPVPAQSDSNTTYFNLRNVLTYASVGGAEIANVNRTLSDRFISRRTTELWNNKAVEGVSTSAGLFASVRINASRLSEQTAEGLANYLTNGLQIFYPLATPQTYQLTPQEITSLLGENNLWADTGDSEVEYRADAKMYVDAKVAAAVSALS